MKKNIFLVIFCFVYAASYAQTTQPITLSAGASWMFKATAGYERDRLAYEATASVLLAGNAGRKHNVNLWVGVTLCYRPGENAGLGATGQLLGLAPSGHDWHLGGGVEIGVWQGPRQTYHWGLPLVARHIAASGFTSEFQISFGFAPGETLLRPSRGTGYTNTRVAFGWSF